MNPITIVCPHCRYSKEIDRAKIPANLKSIKCPRCAESFQLEDSSKLSPPPPSPLRPPPLPEVPSVAAATSAPETPPRARATSRQLSFSFTGSGREYFGIWIVNTLLKIVTLGIYSPWAKVRKRQYFYGNTLLDDANFDYLADPIALLKGWLIGVALFICYSLGSQFSPVLGMVFGLLLFFLIPWVIVRARLFNNRNSAHRNVRFNFHPAYADSYMVYAWLPILSIFTLGLLTPYVYCRQQRFMMENNMFGESSFSFDSGAKAFYIVALKVIGFAILFFGLSFGLTAMLGIGMPTGADGAMPDAVGIFLPLLMMSGYFFILVYGYVRTSNLSWNGTFFDKNRFVSTMRVRDMLWIMFSNIVASVLSVGLLIPWASVRLARYRLDHLALNVVGDLDHYVNGQLEQTSAAGEEIGDIFGVDFGI